MNLVVGWADVCDVFLTVLEDDDDDTCARCHVLNVRLFDAPYEMGASEKASTFFAIVNLANE